MLSDIAYEKLIGIVGMNLPIPEQYLSEFNIFFEQNEIDRIIKQHAHLPRGKAISYAMPEAKNEVSIKNMSDADRSKVINAILNLAYTRIAEPIAKNQSISYLIKIFLLIRDRDKNDNAFHIMWNRLLEYEEELIKRDIDAGHYRNYYSELIHSGIPAFRSYAASYVSNHFRLKILCKQSYDYWSSK